MGRAQNKGAANATDQFTSLLGHTRGRTLTEAEADALFQTQLQDGNFHEALRIIRSNPQDSLRREQQTHALAATLAELAAASAEPGDNETLLHRDASRVASALYGYSSFVFGDELKRTVHVVADPDGAARSVLCGYSNGDNYNGLACTLVEWQQKDQCPDCLAHPDMPERYKPQNMLGLLNGDTSADVRRSISSRVAATLSKDQPPSLDALRDAAQIEFDRGLLKDLSEGAEPNPDPGTVFFDQSRTDEFIDWPDGIELTPADWAVIIGDHLDYENRLSGMEVSGDYDFSDHLYQRALATAGDMKLEAMKQSGPVYEVVIGTDSRRKRVLLDQEQTHLPTPPLGIGADWNEIEELVNSCVAEHHTARVFRHSNESHENNRALVGVARASNPFDGATSNEVSWTVDEAGYRDQNGRIRPRAPLTQLDTKQLFAVRKLYQRGQSNKTPMVLPENADLRFLWKQELLNLAKADGLKLTTRIVNDEVHAFLTDPNKDMAVAKKSALTNFSL